MGTKKHKEREHELFIEHVLPKMIDIAIVLAPMWGWILLHPIAWEVDKTHPGTGGGFNALYGMWVTGSMLEKIPLGAIIAGMGKK